MNDELAEALLSKVMDWSGAENAQERAFLQDFARYKHDKPPPVRLRAALLPVI